jgi:hypothetical protein
MYNQKLACAVKANGKVLREFKDTVYIPFGSEYSLLVKNLNSVRVIATITLDGDDVCPGGLVIGPNQEIDLERWIKNGNLKEGNKFKFIERTAGVEQHRGIKLEDGIIRVEYQFEKLYVQQTTTTWTTTNLVGSASGGMYRGHGQSYPKGIGGSAGEGIGAALNASTVCMSQVTASAAVNTVANDAGITVPGSKSEQKFQTTGWFPTEFTKHVMVLKLLGETPDNKPIVQPVTVKAKPKCITCGKHNKATSKFCDACGTALEIFA